MIPSHRAPRCDPISHARSTVPYTARRPARHDDDRRRCDGRVSSPSDASSDGTRAARHTATATTLARTDRATTARRASRTATFPALLARRRYGDPLHAGRAVDVTEILRHKTANTGAGDRFMFFAKDDLTKTFGDPAPGVLKARGSIYKS